jgi:hypothetical protein
MTTTRQQEATETRTAAAVDFHIRPEDKKMYGTTDWYVAISERGTVKQMRERDIIADPKIVGTVAGPYFTQGQAHDESYGYRLKDNNADHKMREW